MKLDIEESLKFFEENDWESPDDLSILERIVKYDEIAREYRANKMPYKIDIQPGHDILYFGDYPSDGMEEEDLRKILELGIFLDSEYDCSSMFV